MEQQMTAPNNASTAQDIEQERKEFESVAAKYDISIDIAHKPSDIRKPFKYVHTNHLFDIFREGWRAASAKTAAQDECSTCAGTPGVCRFPNCKPEAEQEQIAGSLPSIGNVQV